MEKLIKTLRNWKAAILKHFRDTSLILHFAVAMVVSQVCMIIMFPFVGGWAFPLTIILIGALEAANEDVLDAWGDWNDVLWTGLGVLIGLTLGLLCGIII